MGESSSMVADFEKTYMKPLRSWANYLPSEDLAKVKPLIEGFTKRSEELTRLFKKPGMPQARKESWFSLLAEAQRLVPSLLEQAETLKKEAWVGSQMMQKKQKTLHGYMSAGRRTSGFLDSEA